MFVEVLYTPKLCKDLHSPSYCLFESTLSILSLSGSLRLGHQNMNVQLQGLKKKNQPNNGLLHDFWQQLDGLSPPVKWSVLAGCGGSLKYSKRIIFLEEGIILTEVLLTHFQICTLNVSVKRKMNIISYEISCPWLPYALSCSIVSFSSYSYFVVYFRTSCAVVS